MSWLDDIGAALTGGQAVAPPVQNVGGSLTGLLDDPRARAALLSFGLQAMQPVGIGQTVGGHLAQSVGAAGEGATRADAIDQKNALADAKLGLAEQKIAQGERALDIRERRATGRKIGGLTDLMKMRFAREDDRNNERRLERDAASLLSQMQKVEKSTLPGDQTNYPEALRPYVGKTQPQIREMLRASTPRKAGSAAPATTTDDEEDDDAVATPAVEQPPVAGAVMSNLGWVVPDPKNPGKYLKVK